jgi:hypothetical protein
MTRVRLSDNEKGNAHSAYFDEEGRLVVEWYEFSEKAPYEHATMLIFNQVEQEALAGALGVPPEKQIGEALLVAIRERFDSYFAVRKFADQKRLPYKWHVNFWP